MRQVVHKRFNVKARQRVAVIRILRLDPLEARQANPTLVRANVDVSPFADRFADRHFGSLVNGEQVRAGTVG